MSATNLRNVSIAPFWKNLPIQVATFCSLSIKNSPLTAFARLPIVVYSFISNQEWSTANIYNIFLLYVSTLTSFPEFTLHSHTAGNLKKLPKCFLAAFSASRSTSIWILDTKILGFEGQSIQNILISKHFISSTLSFSKWYFNLSSSFKVCNCILYRLFKILFLLSDNFSTLS